MVPAFAEFGCYDHDMDVSAGIGEKLGQDAWIAGSWCS
jgi:hypothetical protein